MAEYFGTPVALFHFLGFIVVSLIVFVLILRVALRRRAVRPASGRVLAVAFVVVVVGMVFAKWGAITGLSWVIYYGLPALVTVALPPRVFRLRGAEIGEYLLMAFLNAPAIHIVFSLFLGWHEYLPFIHIPSIWSLVRGF